VIAPIFRARELSPLIGIYLPFIESEYVNIPSPNEAGAIGMFQFLPKTGEKFGLSSADLLDVPKSADAAARYIEKGLKAFKGDAMKEALAILSYNRGIPGVERDLTTLATEQDRVCSICTLTQQRARMDDNFQKENVYYVPRFFAAAIVGENPQAFGLQLAPLSSL
jgi:soluble lytic murein transglycosylase-like protein